MRARLLVLLLVAAAGCAAEFDPRSLLSDLRVLALVADRPEIGVRETTTVTAVTWPAQPGTWRYCPFSIGSSAGYACVDPRCEQSFPAPSATLTLTPADNPCVAAALAGGGLPNLPAGFPARLETIVTYTATDPASGLVREAVLRLPVTYPDPPVAPNQNPVVERVDIGGQQVWPAAGGSRPVLANGAELEVRVQLSAPELVAPGQPEGSVISFYSTAGRFEYDRALGPVGSAMLQGKKLPARTSPDPILATVFVVARDLRGGQAVAGPIEVEVLP